MMLSSRTCLQSSVRGLLTDSRLCAIFRLPPVPATPVVPLQSSTQQHRHRLAAKKQSAPDGEPPAAPKRGRKPGSGKASKSAKQQPAADAPQAPRDSSPPKRRGRPPKAKPAVAATATPDTQPATAQPPPEPSPSPPPAAASAPAPDTPPATPTPELASPSPTAPPPTSEPQPATSDQPPTAPPVTPASPVTVNAVNVYDSDVPTEQPPTALAVNRQGYQLFEMDGVELLIAETTTGQLKLSDCYVFDQATDLYAAPEMQGAIPDTHCTYQCIPWTEEYLGDVMSNKEPWTKVQKLVFIPILSEEPYELKLDDVFIFSAASRKLVKMPVERAGPFIVDPVLRIREDKVTIEDARYMPTFMEVQGAGEDGRTPEPSLDAGWLTELQEELAGYRAAQGGQAAAEPVSQ